MSGHCKKYFKYLKRFIRLPGKPSARPTHDSFFIQHLNNLRNFLLGKKDTFIIEFEHTLSMTKELKEEFESFLKEYEAKSELC